MNVLNSIDTVKARPDECRSDGNATPSSVTTFFFGAGATEVK